MSPHSSLDPDSFAGVWGYCAVVGTRELMWSGHRIPDPAGLPELGDYLASLSRGLSLSTPASAKVFVDGAVSWLAGELVEATYRLVNNGEEGAADRVAALNAAALASIVGRRYFIVLLERNRAHESLHASVEPVAVESAEDARDYILRHPRVLALEAEGLKRLQMKGAETPLGGLRGFTHERLHGPLN